MGLFSSKEENESSSDSDMSDLDDDSSKNNNTPLNNNIKNAPNPNKNQNLSKNPNQNIKPIFDPKNINPYPNFDINKNINNISNSSNNNSILGRKHLRSDTEVNNNNINNNKNKDNNFAPNPNLIKTKKIETSPMEQPMNPNQQISRLNKSVIELIEENKKLKKENEDNKKLIYNQNKKLKDIENEIQIKVKEALNQIKNENNENEKFIREQIKKALEHYKEQNEEKLNLIISEIPNEMEKNLEKKAKELENLYYNQYKTKIVNKKNKEIHDGIKCQKCFMQPIIGIRYKCSICKEYNLCDDCEKINEETNDHQHTFFKIVKKEQKIPKIENFDENDKKGRNEENEENIEKENLEKNEENNKYNNINKSKNSYIKKNEIIIDSDKEKKTEKLNNSVNNNINNKYNNNIIESHININKKPADFNTYSYERLTKELEFSIYRGTKNARFNLKLKNNGYYPWPKKNSFLICDSHLSDKIVEKIELDPLNPGDEYYASVFFDDLDELGPGKYNTYLNFNVKNKNFGEQILIIFEILEKSVKPAYDPKIAEFRNNFKIDEKTLSDEVIREALNNNNNDIYKAFEFLYQY